MTKINFLLSLHEKLSDIPREDVEERLSFYSEMIEDQMEDGLSEEEAVAAVGTIDDIAAQIRGDLSPDESAVTIPKRRKKLKTWEIVFLVLGSPIWLSLTIAAVVVMIAFYAVLWAVLISLWAAFGSFVGCAVGGVVVGTGILFGESPISGIALIAAGIICAGIAIFLFFGCKAATCGLLLLTKNVVTCLKKPFLRKKVA